MIDFGKLDWKNFGVGFAFMRRSQEHTPGHCLRADLGHHYCATSSLWIQYSPRRDGLLSSNVDRAQKRV